METIHIKFDELTAMASKHNSLECKTNCFNEYFEKRSPKVSTNSATPTTLHNDDTPSSSLIIVEETEDPPLVSSSEEKISLVLNDVAEESFQEDFVDLDGNTLITLFIPPESDEAESSSTNHDSSNMHEFTQVYTSTHT
ncbi:hypothetical protein Tco_1537810 [Tanacetum coccineum]